MAEAKLHSVEDTEVNDEQNHPKVKQDKIKKESGKRNGKVKKNKDIEFKCSKRATSNQKQLSDLETNITHPFPENYAFLI